jgi:nicotinate-nucleotide pyrophosphorylase (carboxylating)
MNCANLIALIRAELKEDIGSGDITTNLTIPQDKTIRAGLLAKDDLVVCGLDIASRVFKAKDKSMKFKRLTRDGQYVKKGKVLARVEGKARPILTAERTALNFLSLLCGIATRTKAYVDAVKPYPVKIMDTRKTIPGLRELEKYAVRIGGGHNHRMRLDEMVLVKDNHFAASCAMRHASCVKEIIKAIKEKKAKNIQLETEVKNLREFKEALSEKPDIIMLDNMDLGDIKKAVDIRRTTHNAQRTTQLEASGGITLKNVRKIAATGVEMISIGALTDSVESADISLEVC